MINCRVFWALFHIKKLKITDFWRKLLTSSLELSDKRVVFEGI